ncbi:hypothetical protein [Methylacidiphilum caldifontis]|nr:hypothetical protein [Methylacidiphilum caldifontis]
MPTQFFKKPLATLLIFLLIFSLPSINLFEVHAKSLKDTMKEYIEAVRETKEKKLIHFFPKKKAVPLLIYTQGDLSKPHFQWTVNQTQLEKDFKSKGPLYHLFFDKTKTTDHSFYHSKMEGPTYHELFDTKHAAGLTYHDLLKKESKGKWKKRGKSFLLKSPQVCDYIRWEKKQGKWVIEELAITSP